jgi:hypothetical protein
MIEVIQLTYHNFYSALLFRFAFDDPYFDLVFQRAFWNELNTGWLEMNHGRSFKTK